MIWPRMRGESREKEKDDGRICNLTISTDWTSPNAPFPAGLILRRARRRCQGPDCCTFPAMHHVDLEPLLQVVRRPAKSVRGRFCILQQRLPHGRRSALYQMYLGGQVVQHTMIILIVACDTPPSERAPGGVGASRTVALHYQNACRRTADCAYGRISQAPEICGSGRETPQSFIMKWTLQSREQRLNWPLPLPDIAFAPRLPSLPAF